MTTTQTGPPIPLRDALETFLTEIGAAASRLKTILGPRDDHHHLPAGKQAILQVLFRHGPQTVPQIARTRLNSRQNIQLFVNRLKREGIVQFIPNPGHKRSPLVRLTDQGQSALDSAAQQQNEFLESLSARTSETELMSASSLLRKLRQAIADRRQPTPGVPRRSPAGPAFKAQTRRQPRPKRPSSIVGSPLKQPEPVPPEPHQAQTDEAEFPINLL